MFRNRIIKSVISKLADETEVGMAGKSIPHCVAFITFLVLRDCKVVLLTVEIVRRFVGGWMASNASLRAWVPTSISRRHKRA